MAEHRACHGDWCPGFGLPAHADADLVVDHDVGVLCRSCNGRKAATVDKQRARRPEQG
jgi:5-methylcytosine-specific restriction enzyme A